MLGDGFARLVAQRPRAVMGRTPLERVLGADRLHLWYERPAEQPYTCALWLATVYDRLRPVVCGVQPSVRAAYLAHEANVGPSLVSVYHTLHGCEPRTSAALVRESARACAPLMAHMGGERGPWRAGYRGKIVDGHGLDAREYRRQALREAPGRAWPGQALVVSERAPRPGHRWLAVGRWACVGALAAGGGARDSRGGCAVECRAPFLAPRVSGGAGDVWWLLRYAPPAGIAL
jgi:hypothetical protein